jgi:FAD:protein FMN transferase
MRAEDRFLAMGGTAHVVVLGQYPAALVSAARHRLGDLERRWSRFLDTSEISRLNAAAGSPVAVSPETLQLIAHSLQAWRQTGGRFDPTVHAALVAHGYDRDFALVSAVGAPSRPLRRSTPGCAGIVVDVATSRVRLPVGVTIDPGGIGKGLAADLVTAELIATGATGAMVNVAGDLRVRGEAPSAEGWVISVPHPLHPGRELLRVGLSHGAVATSSRLKRRWRAAGQPVHHLIDPATGTPTDNDVAAVTVFAAEAWWAEGLTKSIAVAGEQTPPDLADAAAVVIARSGAVRTTPGLSGVLT